MKKLSTWVIIILVVVSLALYYENLDLHDEIDDLNEEYSLLENRFYDEYERGYQDGSHETSVGFSSGDYFQIDDMSTDEIIEYLQDRVDDKIWLGQDAYSFAVYTFQQGYAAHKNGRWDEVTKELMTGYEFSKKDIAEFSRLLG